jgi:type IV pilus assembly protein PilN
MAKINLLPWREELREQRKKEFFVIIGAALMLALVVAGLTWAFFNNRLSDQEQANQQVVSANSQLDSKLKSLDGLQDRRDAIVARMKVIQDLQGKRPVVVRLFDELTRMMPANMYLTRFKREGDKFTLEGKAESPNTVSELLRNLEASPWFRNAFMNAFQGVVIAPDQAQPAGAVVPRPEDGYGTFVVSVDLEEAEEVGTSTPTDQPVAKTGSTS